jgi:hypothetical protein
MSQMAGHSLSVLVSQAAGIHGTLYTNHAYFSPSSGREAQTGQQERMPTDQLWGKEQSSQAADMLQDNKEAPVKEQG